MHDASKRWTLATVLSPEDVRTAFRKTADEQKTMGVVRLWQRADASQWTNDKDAIARKRRGIGEHPRFPAVVCSAWHDGSRTIAQLYVATGKVHSVERKRVVALMEGTVSKVKKKDGSADLTKEDG